MKKQLLKKGIKMLFLAVALAGNAMAQNLLTTNPSFETNTGSGSGQGFSGTWARANNANGTSSATLIYPSNDNPQAGSFYLEAITPADAAFNSSDKLFTTNAQNLKNTIIGGKTYKLSFYYKNTAGHTFKALVQDNTGGAPNTFNTTVSTEATNWTLHEYTFVATNELAAVSDLRIILQFGANAGTTKIDNVQLLDMTPTTGGPNILPNPSFETDNGSGGFNLWARSGPVTAETATPQEGLRYAKATLASIAGNPWDVQLYSNNFTVIPGHQYQIKFYYKADKAFKLVLQNTTYQETTISTPASSWTVHQENRTFTENTMSLKFHFNTGAAGFVEIDNISVIDLTALPVTLNSFSAKANANSIAVNWKTETETNNSHFELFRAGKDGVFKYLANITAKNIGSSYTFSDNNPLNGINYYKLLQYDLDGKVNEIKEIAFANFDLNNIELSLYPNPTTTRFNFNLSDYVGESFKVQLTDLSGKTIKTETLTATDGLNTVNLPKGLNAGLYFVKISGKNLSKTSKLIIK